jgi:hypothetical protein
MEKGLKEIKAAIETMRTASLVTKKELATVLESLGVVSRYGSPVRFPLEDGSQVSLDLQDNLFDPENRDDGYCHIAIISRDVAEDEYSDDMDVDYNSAGYEVCPEPTLVAKAIRFKLQEELRALQEWDRRVTEITRLLSR